MSTKTGGEAMKRRLWVAGLTAWLGMAAGCGGDGEHLYIVGSVPFDSNCGVPGTATAFRGGGTWDLLVASVPPDFRTPAFSYFVPMVIANRAVGNTAATGVAQSKVTGTEKTVAIQSALVDYGGTADASGQLVATVALESETPGGAPTTAQFPLPAPVRLPIDGVSIAPAGSQGIAVDIFRNTIDEGGTARSPLVELASTNELAAILPPDGSLPWRELDLPIRITLEGKTPDGDEVTSNTLIYNLTICRGCLAICPTGEVADFSEVCFPGQDEPAACSTP
jgi:hypothetical protein